MTVNVRETLKFYSNRFHDLLQLKYGGSPSAGSHDRKKLITLSRKNF